MFVWVPSATSPILSVELRDTLYIVSYWNSLIPFLNFLNCAREKILEFIFPPFNFLKLLFIIIIVIIFYYYYVGFFIQYKPLWTTFVSTASFLPFSFPSISLSFFPCVYLSFPQSKQLLFFFSVFLETFKMM